jgi:hypothetical protein
MTDDEKRQVLAAARSTVARLQGGQQQRAFDDHAVPENRKRRSGEESSIRFSDPVARLPQQCTATKLDHWNEPDDKLLTDREQCLLETIGQEFGERDEQIEKLKRQVAELRCGWQAEFVNDIKKLFEGFSERLDAAFVQLDRRNSSTDRREPLDLPPLPLTRRVN